MQSICLSQVIVQEERNILLDQEEAYTAYLDNRLKSVETWWAIRDIYNERQEIKFKEIQQHRQFYLDRYALKAITEEEIDLRSGTILWIKPLMQDRYSEYRDIYDRYFKKKVYNGLEMEEYSEVKETSKKWRILIASQKKYYPQPIVNEMIRFILKIDREIAKI